MKFGHAEQTAAGDATTGAGVEAAQLTQLELLDDRVDETAVDENATFKRRRDDKVGAEFVVARRQRLFGLRVKGRIRDLRVHDERQTLSNVNLERKKEED